MVSTPTLYYMPLTPNLARRPRRVAMKKKRRKAELPAELVGLLAWLEQRGVTLDNIELRTTSSAGVGLFARRDLSAGEELVALPFICALTAGVALASALGVAVAAAAESLDCSEACTAELVMWLFMCRSRTEPSTKDGCGHSWHAYLASLPPAPDPASWPEAQRAELHGTTVGGAVDEALQHVAHCQGVVAQLATEVRRVSAYACTRACTCACSCTRVCMHTRMHMRMCIHMPGAGARVHRRGGSALGARHAAQPPVPSTPGCGTCGSAGSRGSDQCC